MKRKIYKNDVAVLLKQGIEIVNATATSRYHNRVAAVNAVLYGNLPGEVSKWFGVSSRTLTMWVKKVDDFGFESLKDKPKPGALPKLDDGQRNELDTVLQHPASEFGYKVWDGNSLSDLIKKKYNIELGVRQCQRLFHKLGYSKIRPQTYPSKGNEQSEAREEFLKKSGYRR